jgi:hypothetical protein
MKRPVIFLGSILGPALIICSFPDVGTLSVNVQVGTS